MVTTSPDESLSLFLDRLEALAKTRGYDLIDLDHFAAHKLQHAIGDKTRPMVVWSLAREALARYIEIARIRILQDVVSTLLR